MTPSTLYTSQRKKRLAMHQPTDGRWHKLLATGYADAYDKWSAGGVTPTAYFGVDVHLKSDKVGLLITWQPDCFIGAGLRFSL